MDRCSARPRTRRRSVPRLRGDGPPATRTQSGGIRCSPPTRGWTVEGEAEEAEAGVFPAYAGMDRCSENRKILCLRVPRLRGDGPHWFRSPLSIPLCSPPSRPQPAPPTVVVKEPRRVVAAAVRRLHKPVQDLPLFLHACSPILRRKLLHQNPPFPYLQYLPRPLSWSPFFIHFGKISFLRQRIRSGPIYYESIRFLFKRGNNW